MTDEPFEVKEARGLVARLREREQVLAPAVDELGRTRALLADAEKALARALRRAGLDAGTSGEPGADTDAGRLLAALRKLGTEASLGQLVSRTRVPAESARTLMGRLTADGFVKRVGHGRYEAITRGEDDDGRR